MRVITRSTKGKIPPRYKHRIDENKSLWHRWNGIKKRCLAVTDARYPDYGGRGIKICQEWLDSFDNFYEWAHANGYRDDLTIERIDVNGDYCPENCKWIPLKDQAFNKRETIWVDYKGRHIQLLKLCQEKGLKYDPIHNRIMDLHWDVERAIDEPLNTNDGSLMSKCEERGLCYGTVRDRIRKLGWTEEEALNTPTWRGKSKQHYSQRGFKEICLNCGKEFIKITGAQVYCCAECREAAKETRRKANVHMKGE